MTMTININTYDPAGRFNFNEEKANRFFDYVTARAINLGYDVCRVSQSSVDEKSEAFINDCFEIFE